MDSETKEELQPTSPHEQFGRFVDELKHSENLPLTPAIIQMAAEVFNTERKDKPDVQVSILYHFTDNQGANEIKQSEELNVGTEGKIYLTEVTPQDAVPLMGGEDAKKFEAYLKGDIVPKNMKENMEKFVLGMKFKWRHGIVRRLTNMVPIGEHKLENVLILAVSKSRKENILKRDKYGEIYVDQPIKRKGDSNFYMLGPFSST